MFLFLGNYTIIANVIRIPIIGGGNDSLLPSINFKDVLYVLKLFDNFIFVQKLTHEMT